jgi:hypothetical protein
MPSMRMTVTFGAALSGSRFVGVRRFASLESMEQLVKVGMIEGLRSAMGQLDAVLAGRSSSPAAVRVGRQLRRGGASRWGRRT